jgi:hypothetical protein
MTSKTKFFLRNVQPAAGLPGTPWTATLYRGAALSINGEEKIATVSASSTGRLKFAFKDEAPVDGLPPDAWFGEEADRVRSRTILRKRLTKAIRLKTVFLLPTGEFQTAPQTPHGVALARKAGGQVVGHDLDTDAALDPFIVWCDKNPKRAMRDISKTHADRKPAPAPKAAAKEPAAVVVKVVVDDKGAAKVQKRMSREECREYARAAKARGEKVSASALYASQPAR